MTVMAHTPVEDLERGVSRARRSLRGHMARCDSWCVRCEHFQDRLDAAERRLDAARSQTPERQIDIHAAGQRRVERDRGAAA